MTFLDLLDPFILSPAELRYSNFLQDRVQVKAVLTSNQDNSSIRVFNHGSICDANGKICKIGILTYAMMNFFTSDPIIILKYYSRLNHSGCVATGHK